MLPRFTSSIPPFIKGRIKIRVRKPPKYPREKPKPEIVPVLFLVDNWGRNEL